MKCYACDKGTLSHGMKQQVFTYKGTTIMLDQPGLWCDCCEEWILNDKDIAKIEKVFEAFKAEVDGLLTPKQIRHIKKELYLVEFCKRNNLMHAKFVYYLQSYRRQNNIKTKKEKPSFSELFLSKAR
jgi:putative zinc finger/helix-turn-helix YgiT family protein